MGLDGGEESGKGEGGEDYYAAACGSVGVSDPVVDVLGGRGLF